MSGSLFGPISKDYCIYFFVISAFYLILFAIALFGAVYLGISRGKNVEYFVITVGATFSYFLLYLQNRLLYNMCAKTL